MLPDPGALGSIPEEFSEEKIVDIAKVKQRCRLEGSGQWLENVDPTHPTGKWHASTTKKRLTILARV